MISLIGEFCASPDSREFSLFARKNTNITLWREVRRPLTCGQTQDGEVERPLGPSEDRDGKRRLSAKRLCSQSPVDAASPRFFDQLPFLVVLHRKINHSGR